MIPAVEAVALHGEAAEFNPAARGPLDRSADIKDLAAALAKAQASVAGAKKDSKNPHFNSRYADLASVWDACREALTANGLSVAQAPRLVPINDTAMMVEVETTLFHTSGQWLSSCLGMPLAKQDAHGIGSAITYARRYALSAMIGVAPEDDDGVGAVAPQPERGKPALAPGETQTAKVKVTTISPKNAQSGLYSIVTSDRQTYKTTNEKYIAAAKSSLEAGVPVEIAYLQKNYHRDIVTLKEEAEAVL